MNTHLAVFLLGLVVFLIMSVGLLVLYAWAAQWQAHHERSTSARMTLKLLRMLGLETHVGEER